MKIGILGSGPVGKVLAEGFIRHGYEVMIGTRSPDKLSEWKAQAGKSSRVGSFSEAAAFGKILVLAARGITAIETLELAGSDHLHTNRIP
jgi:predicted dinucleotide-binding enzyme